MNNNLDQPSLDQDAELRKAIDKETIDLLYQALPGSAFVTIIIAATLSFVMARFFEGNVLIVWFVIILFINIARILLYRSYSHRDKNINKTSIWDNLFYLFVILNGLCFSVVGFLFLPDASSAYHYFPIMVLIGLATGAVSSLSFSMRNISTYFILLLVPVLINEIMIGTFLSFSIAGLVLLSMIFSLVNAKRIYQTSIENITLNFLSEKHTQELIESRNAAIAANSAKTNFISMISHELRTPLNGMLGFSQLLAMSDSPPLNEEQRDHNQGIVDAGKHLLSLIEELLDLAKIESHKLNVMLEDVSLADNLSESIALLNPVAAGFKIELVNNVENIYLVKADAKRLKQVFINLISNAIKYNHKQGKVTINVKNVEGIKVRIFVTDTGSGLTDEQMHGLFQPFQRYDSSKEGLGLGLYITQHIVELMGGVTGVESELNKGSTFWFELSLA